MLGNQWAIVKVREDEEGERFVIRYETDANAMKAGYMWNESDFLTEEQLTKTLAEAGGSPGEIARVLASARAGFTVAL